MTNQKLAQAIVDRFKMDTKESDYTVIEGDDADQLILDIAAALDQRERETWEAAAKRLDEYNDDMGRYDPGLQRIVDWCRAQAQEVGHE